MNGGGVAAQRWVRELEQPLDGGGESFAAGLRRRRLHVGVSQGELGAAAGVHRITVINAEAGRPMAARTKVWLVRALEAFEAPDGALDEVRAQRDALAAQVLQLRYERRLLGAARRLLDQAAGEALTVAAQQAYAEVASRIVDEIGHPVTDEAVLGPGMREVLAWIVGLDDVDSAARRTVTLSQIIERARAALRG